MKAFVPNWLRGTARFVEGWIVLDDYIPASVLPYEQRVIDLAGMRSPEDAVRFGTQYGMLRHRWRAPKSREPFVDGGRVPPVREQFADWLEESAKINRVIDYYMAIRQANAGDPEALNRIVPNDPIIVGHAIGQAIKEGIGTVTVVPETRDLPTGLGFERVIVCESLLSVVYNDLVALMEGEGREFRHCDDCGRYFLVGDPRQRYCNTTCANRAAYHRRAARARSQPR